MAFKEFALDDEVSIKIYKRRNSRNIRLTIAGTGEVRVSIPLWAPYSSGLKFAQSRLQWIKEQQHSIDLLDNNQPIGKAHRLFFAPKDGLTKPTTRLKTGEIIVSYPPTMTIQSPSVQAAAQTASIKALRQQAEQLLPQRLADLATKHGFTYKSVAIKRLKGRWGSCDSQKHIVLNLFLMQMPWEYIDYVIIHELAHTEVLRHGPDFWAVVEANLPNAKQLRKQMKQYHPVLRGPERPAVS